MPVDNLAPEWGNRRTSAVFHGKLIGRGKYNDATRLDAVFARDALGQISTVTDPKQIRWAYAYDGLSHRTVSNDPDLGSWSYPYHAAGRLASQPDAAGQLTQIASTSFASKDISFSTLMAEKVILAIEAGLAQAD